MTNTVINNGQMKLQKAALTFVSENMVHQDELSKMKRIFQALDKNLDGSITKEEIISGLSRLGMPNANAEADRIFNQIDMDGDGEIEFNEWCKATMNKRKALGR